MNEITTLEFMNLFLAEPTIYNKTTYNHYEDLSMREWCTWG